MKFILCIPVDLDIADTKRNTVKNAGKVALVEMARNPEATATMLRAAADNEMYLVRTPTEPMYGEKAK